jgi:hypothetical protein
LSTDALDTLGAVSAYVASSPDVQQLQTTRSSGGCQPTVDLLGVAACLLPQLDVPLLLQNVVRACGAQQPSKRRHNRLLPFLGGASLQRGGNGLAAGSGGVSGRGFSGVVRV